MKRIACLLAFVGIIPVLLLAKPEEAPVVKPTIYTPDSSVRFAAADLATIPEEDRPYIRYLSLYNIPKERRREMAQIVSFMVNSLGTRRRMYIPLFVGGSDETVIRLNIDDYEWKTKAWEDLAKNGSGVRAQAEPYFHAFIEKLSTKKTKRKVQKEVTKERKIFLGHYADGTPAYRTEQYTETIEVEEEIPAKPQNKRIFTGAPWVDKNSWGFLIQWTESESPILRADWFLINVSLPPAYYDFLKLGDKHQDFLNLIFANEALAKKARSQDKAVVITSTVARNNRTMVRSPTFTGGYYWVTHDTLKSVDDRQYILNFLKEKFDATEDIGTLPNGLQAYFLTNGKGERQDAAPTDVAIDNTAIDRTVRPGRSCIICHVEGLRPIEDEIRTLTKKLQNTEQIKLLITDKKDARRVEDLFSSDLDAQLVKDNNLYAAAVAKTNGLSSGQTAKFFSKIYDDYAEILLTKAAVASDLGIPEADLDKYIKLSLDPVVLGLLKTPIRPIRRDQWERSFQGMMLIIMSHRVGAVPIGVAVPPIPVFTPKK